MMSGHVTQQLRKHLQLEAEWLDTQAVILDRWAKDLQEAGFRYRAHTTVVSAIQFRQRAGMLREVVDATSDEPAAVGG